MINFARNVFRRFECNVEQCNIGSTGIVGVGGARSLYADSPRDIRTLSHYYFLIRLSRLNNACYATGCNLCLLRAR